jgi:hypothetical protein
VGPLDSIITLSEYDKDTAVGSSRTDGLFEQKTATTAGTHGPMLHAHQHSTRLKSRSSPSLVAWLGPRPRPHLLRIHDYSLRPEKNAILS